MFVYFVVPENIHSTIRNFKGREGVQGFKFLEGRGYLMGIFQDGYVKNCTFWNISRCICLFFPKECVSPLVDKTISNDNFKNSRFSSSFWKLWIETCGEDQNIVKFNRLLLFLFCSIVLLVIFVVCLWAKESVIKMWQMASSKITSWKYKE